MTTIMEHEEEQVRRANATEMIDSGWRTVADTSLPFVQRFV